jgi:hypothetical protein
VVKNRNKVKWKSDTSATDPSIIIFIVPFRTSYVEFGTEVLLVSFGIM